MPSEDEQKWSRIAYDLGAVNIALFGWALLLYSGGMTGIMQTVLGATGLGLWFVGLWLMLVMAAECLIFTDKVAD